MILHDGFDVDALERAEQQIDEFIRKRSREKADEQKIAELWAESDRREREKRRRENRRAWLEYERHLERVHMNLALEHRSKAEALTDVEAV